MKLKGKTAIVTGGASGIGKNIVQKLIKEDVTVCVFDVNKESMKDLKKKSELIHTFLCDVSENNQVEKAVNDAYTVSGEVHILINNAGIVKDSPLVNILGGMKKHSVDTWNQVIATNLSSVFYLTSNVAERMVKKRTKGVIINISSIAASGNPGQTAYSAAKAGVNALTRLWADELGFFNIRVAAVAPGFTNTKITQKMNSKRREEWEQRTPLRRLAEPEEIADAVLFIMKNDFFNGKILQIDGGLRL